MGSLTFEHFGSQATRYLMELKVTPVLRDLVLMQGFAGLLWSQETHLPIVLGLRLHQGKLIIRIGWYPIWVQSRLQTGIKIQFRSCRAYLAEIAWPKAPGRQPCPELATVNLVVGKTNLCVTPNAVSQLITR